MKRKIGNTLWFMLTFSLVSLAVMVTSIRVVLPSLNNNIELFQNWSSEKLGKDIEIGHVKVSWLDNKPALRFQEVKIKDPESKTNLLEVGDVFLIFRPLKSLFQLEPTFGTITLTGLHLSVTEAPDPGKWRIQGLDSVLENATSQPQENAKGIEDLLAWLTAQASVRIKASSIEWRKNEQEILPIYIDELTLQNHSSIHNLVGKFLMALDTPATLVLTSSLTGDLLHPNSLKGRWYANLSHAKLKEWQPFIAQLPKTLDALVDIHNWGTINSQQEIQTDWELSAKNLAVKLPSKSEKFNFSSAELKSNLHFKDNFVSSKSRIRAKARQDAPEVETLIQTQSTLKDEGQQHKLFISEFDLSYLRAFSAFLPVESNLPIQLDKLETNGRLEDISLSYHDKSNLKMTAKLKDVALYQIQDAEDKLGFSGLNGSFFTDLVHTRLSLKSPNIAVSLPDIFPNTLDTGEIDGDISFEKKGNQRWTLASKQLELHPSNQKIKFSFQYDDNASLAPHLSYLASFAHLDKKIFKAYLPEKVMGNHLPLWLKTAIKHLSLTKGRSLFHGPVSDFPFNLGTGVFQTEAKVESLALNYSEDWPQIDNGNGTLAFYDASLDIHLDKALIAGMQMETCHGRIDNLEQNSLLVISADISGRGSDLTHFLHTSPLKSSFGENAEDFIISGPTKLSLKLEQPLGKSTRDFDLEGLLTLNNNQLALLDKNWIFSEMFGEVSFKHNALAAKDLSATFFENPVTIQLGSSRLADQGLEIKAKIDGKLGVDSLAKQFPHPFFSHLLGQTKYSALIKLRDNHQGSVNTNISIETELDGIEIALPAPLGKTAEQKKPLRAYLDVFPAQKTAQTNIQYARDASARLLFGLEPTNQLKSFVLSMGPEPIKVKPTEGFFLKGQVPELNIDAWKPIVTDFLKKGEDEQGQPLEMKELRLQVKLFDFLGNQFTDLKLEAMPKSDAWDLYIDSPNLAGIIEIPNQESSLNINLKKLKLSSMSEQKESHSLKPSDIPKMAVNIDKLFFDGKPIGHLSFSYNASSPNLVNINDLLLKRPASELNAKLQWIANGSSEQTLLQFTFDTEDIQAAVKDWGMDTGMKETKGKLSSTLQWPGAPSAFNFSDASGVVKLDLKGGRLVDVDPGATRLFGLWSLQTLTRRLSLDFSDLYKKGLTFDSIEGQFKLQNGNAYTCDTRLVSPSTRVEIKGRTGLVKKDFEQIANVALSITDPVPYIVAIFNPVAGALTWLGSKALEKTIDKMTGLRYLILGPWENPEVQPLGPILKEAVDVLPGIDSGNAIYAKSAEKIKAFESFCAP